MIRNMAFKIFAASAVISGIICTPLYAQSLNGDFTFKRVTVPTSSTAKRITVQIAPQAPQSPSAPNAAGQGGAIVQPAAVAPSAPKLSGFEWFWEKISADLGYSDTNRLADAMAALQNPPNGSSNGAPRLQTLQDIAQTHGIEILKATIGTEVSPAFVLALISVESAGKPAAVSSAGATGLMQLMPATAERFGVTDRTDPVDNIKGGVAYLDWLMKEFGNDPFMVLAGYNAGENAVKKHNGVPPYAETRGYVPKVISAWAVARGLCITPPQLVTDGCVFSISSSN